MLDKQEKSFETPLSIVDRYRILYRNKYMTPTLLGNGRKTFRIPAFSEEHPKFNGSFIVIDYSVQPNDDVWATNTIHKINETYQAVIHVDPNIDDQSPIIRKYIYAHEWIEIMYCFHNDSRITLKRIEKNKNAIDTLNALNNLKRRCAWQDKVQDVDMLAPALRNLLVSHDSIMEFLKHKYSMTLTDFKDRLQRGDSEIYENVCRGFSIKWSVHVAMVKDRMDELVYGE